MLQSSWKNSLMCVAILLLISACQRINDETKAKISYWKKQIEIMTLAGPQKQKVFAWVYAIDSSAVYSGDHLLATLETIQAAEDSDGGCIQLEIEFDERERVKSHKVSLVSQCRD